MKAQDVMSRDVVTVPADASILVAARLMLQRRISGLPVVDSDQNLVGIVTEGDFLRRAETGTVKRRPRWVEFIMGPGRLADEYTHAAGRVVRDVMTTDVETVAEDAPLEDIVALMERLQIKRVPVTRDRQLIGIVTRQDLLRAVVSSSMRASAAETSDSAIRAQLLDELRTQPWSPLMIDVVVTDGQVKLKGTIYDERQRDALRITAENIVGVRGVEDQLVWIEPMSGMVIEPRAA